jgi:hypothetical protein
MSEFIIIRIHNAMFIYKLVVSTRFRTSSEKGPQARRCPFLVATVFCATEYHHNGSPPWKRYILL